MPTPPHPLSAMPTTWDRALVLAAHPGDIENEMAAAVAHWVAEGKDVRYVLGSRGESGLPGTPPEVAGPLREEAQRRSAAAAGVDSVTFLGAPDGGMRDTPTLRDAIADVLRAESPALVLIPYRGEPPVFPRPGRAHRPGPPDRSPSPCRPGHPDHIGFGHAVIGAYDLVAGGIGAIGLYESSPEPTHLVTVADHIGAPAVGFTLLRGRPAACGGSRP